MSNILDNDISSSEPLGSLLASRLRRERETRGWSITELAELSSVSRSMISKIERDEVSPTTALLGKLSGAFGLTVSALLARAEADAGGDRVARHQEQSLWTDPETGYLRRQLSPPGADPELVRVEMPPGAEVGYPAASYAFVRGQCVWVLEGALTIVDGDEETKLAAGDCMALDLSTPRARIYANRSPNKVAKYVVTLARR